MLKVNTFVYSVNWEGGYLIFFGSSIDVPQADGVIIAGRKEMPIEVRVPREAVPFLLMTSEA